eukprot:3287793-Rhodomonas_salina.2
MPSACMLDARMLHVARVERCVWIVGVDSECCKNVGSWSVRVQHCSGFENWPGKGWVVRERGVPGAFVGPTVYRILHTDCRPPCDGTEDGGCTVEELSYCGHLRA